MEAPEVPSPRGRAVDNGLASDPAAGKPIMFGTTSRREHPGIVDEWAAGVQQLDRRSIVTGIKAITGRDDLLPRLGEISAPTLVVVGEEDKPLPPSRARLISEGIPGAELAVIEAAGHVSPLEQPERFNAALLAFLERL
ncbi:MAG: alpha/beta fold hydrolase [Mycobacterium sp.]